MRLDARRRTQQVALTFAPYRDLSLTAPPPQPSAAASQGPRSSPAAVRLGRGAVGPAGCELGIHRVPLGHVHVKLGLVQPRARRPHSEGRLQEPLSHES